MADATNKGVRIAIDVRLIALQHWTELLITQNSAVALSQTVWAIPARER
jgi:hypothetical protein